MNGSNRKSKCIFHFLFFVLFSRSRFTPQKYSRYLFIRKQHKHIIFHSVSILFGLFQSWWGRYSRVMNIQTYKHTRTAETDTTDWMKIQRRTKCAVPSYRNTVLTLNRCLFVAVAVTRIRHTENQWKRDGHRATNRRKRRKRKHTIILRCDVRMCLGVRIHVLRVTCNTYIDGVAVVGRMLSSFVVHWFASSHRLCCKLCAWISARYSATQPYMHQCVLFSLDDAYDARQWMLFLLLHDHKHCAVRKKYCHRTNIARRIFVCTDSSNRSSYASEFVMVAFHFTWNM